MKRLIIFLLILFSFCSLVVAQESADHVQILLVVDEVNELDPEELAGFTQALPETWLVDDAGVAAYTLHIQPNVEHVETCDYYGGYTLDLIEVSAVEVSITDNGSNEEIGTSEFESLTGFANCPFQHTFTGFSRSDTLITGTLNPAGFRAWVAETLGQSTIYTDDNGITMWVSDFVSASYSPDSTEIIATFGNQTFIYNAVNLTTHNRLDMEGDNIFSAQFSPDGNRIMAIDFGSIILRDALDGNELLRIEVSDVYQGQFNPDGDSILASGFSENVSVLDANSGEVILEITHDDTVQSASFSPDGQSIITTTQDGKIHIWNANSGEKIDEFMVDEGVELRDAFISPIGTELAVIGRLEDEGAFFEIWNIETGEARLEFPGYQSVSYLRYSHDGLKLAIAVDDGAIIINPQSGEVLEEIPPVPIGIQSLEFSVDGSQLLYTDWDSFTVWNLAS